MDEETADRLSADQVIVFNRKSRRRSGASPAFVQHNRPHPRFFILLMIFCLEMSSAPTAGPTLCAADDAVSVRQPLLPGLEWIRWDGRSYCRVGDPTIGVMVVDPRKFRFQVFHYSQEGKDSPLTIDAWLEHSCALAVFNAGQYYPDYSYMGLLIQSGQTIQGRLHHSFEALFAAEPSNNRLPRARILDLAMDPFDPERPHYRQIAQSFMLLDRLGNLRVQQSAKVANRTIVAEGREGRIWVFVTQGGYTLWEFAEMLKSGPFPIRQAMAMDGGYESQMLIKVGSFSYDNLDGGDASTTLIPGPIIRKPLPTVIGVFPR
jgi:uncharacterized protein YigE (DUF2233 family)